MARGPMPAPRGWQVLLDLAAGRDAGPVEMDPVLLEQALDHRMTGLLCSHLQARGAGDLEVAMLDLRIQAHQARIHRLLDRCLAAAAAIDVEVVVLKGASIEHRFYGRSGERPSSDVDLWVPLGDRTGLVALVRALHPDHPWLDGLDRMVARRQVQSVTLQVDNLEVDVHVDPLKLGVWTRQHDHAWSSTQLIDLGEGRRIRVLDDDWTLLLLLVHVSKDRFQRLLGYADVVRLMRAGTVSWPRVLGLAEGEGIAHLVDWALAVIEEDLGLVLRPATDAGQVVPSAAPPRRTPRLRRLIWHRLWRREIRLRGSEGRRRFRFRQNLLPLLADGRIRETLRWWRREVFPPATAVAAEYPHIPGPYLRRLLVGRVRATRARRQHAPVDQPSTQQEHAR